MTVQRTNRLRGKSESGATLVEFAVVFPLLLVLLFGVIEFGRLITTFVTVSTASREGARFGTAIGEATPGTPQYIDCAGIVDAALAKAFIGGLTAADVTVVWDRGPGTGAFADCDPSAALPDPDSSDDTDPGFVASGDRVSVTVEKQFTSFIPLISNFIGTMDLESTDNRTIFKGVLSG